MTASLADLTTVEVSALGPNAVAVQPIGAIEQHGPHLPLVTDALIADRITSSALARTSCPAVTLPLLSYGKSTEHRSFPGTIALSTETLLAVCRDIGRSVADTRIGSLVFVNGHGGQPHLLELVARDIRAETGLKVFVITPMRFGAPAGTALGDEAYGIHAGELETSVMLHLAPELVHIDQAVPGGRTVGSLFAGFEHLTLEGALPTAWLTADLSANGVLGDPRTASAATGAAVVEHWVDALATALGEIARFDFPSPEALAKEAR